MTGGTVSFKAFNGTNRNKIRIRNWTNVTCVQRHEGLGAAGGSYELDFETVWGIDLDNGAEIAGTETVLGDVPNEHYRVKTCVVDGYLGYTVTNRRMSSPANTIQTLTTSAAPLQDVVRRPALLAALVVQSMSTHFI